VARWEGPTVSYGFGPRPNLGRLSGSLEVVTIGMTQGYLRRNGVPYSGDTVLTEHLTRIDEPNGDTFLIVQAIVVDPVYLNQPFIRSTPFRKETDVSEWDPTPCAAL
jgi:hypothetical protein